MAKFCAGCGAPVDPQARFCEACGTPSQSVSSGDRPIAPVQPVVETKNEKASFVVAVIALCFSALAAAWSFVGGACCGWGGWGWAFIGLVLSIVSLVLKPSTLGWWALGLAIFAFAWVFISLYLLGLGAGRAIAPFRL